MSLLKLLCWIKHDWQEPYHREYIRSTGLNVLFVTSGIQYGRRRCTWCDAEQDVYREGFAGLGGVAGKWRRCSAKEKARIECLPVL